MRNIKFKIGYDGSKFKGWQRLGDQSRTVQGVIEKTLSDILGEEIQVTGCGRTDAGVHAIEYVLNFHAKSVMEVEEIASRFSRNIPSDVQIYEAKECGERFHSRYNCRKKTYLYKIDNQIQMDLFSRRYKKHVPDVLDIEKMKEVAAYLEGEHDFQSFTTLKAKNKSTVRTIYKIEIKKVDSNLYIRITADGFLWNMMRIIVGTLIDVGKGQLNTDQVREILEKKERAKAPGKVEAKALYLESIEY